MENIEPLKVKDRKINHAGKLNVIKEEGSLRCFWGSTHKNSPTQPTGDEGLNPSFLDDVAATS